MIFNTHNRTPKIQTNKTLKIMLISCWSLMVAFFLFFAIATSVMSQSILPAVIILIPITLITVFAIITTIDMNKAYVQIDGESIIAVDYYFFLRKEKCFTIDEIKTAEIALGYSFRVRGYRYSMMGFSLYDATFSPSLSQGFENYFIGLSQMTIGPELEIVDIEGNPKTVQLISLDNTNRYFSSDEVSEDPVSYIGVYLYENPDNQVQMMELYILDHTSKSFMPELEAGSRYGAEKPVATEPGFYFCATFAKY